MELEVCTYSLESCVAARNAGATRVELCASPFEGGTTPSAATIREASRLLKEGDAHSPLQLYVMIRPRGGDFWYSPLEFVQMEAEIELVKSLYCLSERPLVDGVVFGLLTPDGRIDPRTAQLVARAKNGACRHPETGEELPCARLGVTFHRAFDMCHGAEGEAAATEALEAVIATGADRILTSGFHPTALEGKEVLKFLVAQAKGRIAIMAGCGVGPENAGELVRIGADALHMSGKGVRESEMKYRNPVLSMGGAQAVSEYSILYTREEAVRRVREIMDKNQ